MSGCLFLFCKQVHLYHILDSTNKWYYMVFVFLFLTYFTLYDNLQGHPCCCTWHYFILFYGWVIFHCVCVCVCVYIYIYIYIYTSSLSIHLASDSLKDATEIKGPVGFTTIVKTSWVVSVLLYCFLIHIKKERDASSQTKWYSNVWSFADYFGLNFWFWIWCLNFITSISRLRNKNLESPQVPHKYQIKDIKTSLGIP